jgi:hypothetical protein
MGLNQETPTTNAVYVSISEGKLRVRYKEPNASTTTRTTKDGNVVYEWVADSISGIVRSISTADSDFGKQWRIVIEDDQRYILNVKYTSNYGKTIIQALCNPAFDGKQAIKIVPYSFSPDDNPKKTIIGATVYQNGNKLERPYCTSTRPDPTKTQLPDLVVVMINGRTEYDHAAQLAFIEAELASKVTPKLSETKTQATTAMPTTTTVPVVDSEDDGSLPF